MNTFRNILFLLTFIGLNTSYGKDAQVFSMGEVVGYSNEEIIYSDGIAVGYHDAKEVPEGSYSDGEVVGYSNEEIIYSDGISVGYHDAMDEEKSSQFHQYTIPTIREFISESRKADEVEELCFTDEEFGLPLTSYEEGILDGVLYGFNGENDFEVNFGVERDGELKNCLVEKMHRVE